MNNKSTRRLYQDWAELFEARPERFLIGTDFKFNKRNKKGNRKGAKSYSKEIRAIRRILGSLAPEAANKIAFGNAQRIYGM